MNKVLQLKGVLGRQGNVPRAMFPNIPKNKGVVHASHLRNIVKELKLIEDYWKENNVIKGVLLSVYYKKVVAKSNRIKNLLAKGSVRPNGSIVGSRFIFNDKGEPIKHVFTHFIGFEELNVTIDRLENCIFVLEEEFGGAISHDDINNIIDLKKHFNNISRSVFLQVIVDCFFVDKFVVDEDRAEVIESSIISLYKTGVDNKELLNSLGINMNSLKMLDDVTVRLTPDELSILIQKAPYLIAMKTSDLSKLEYRDFADNTTCVFSIPSPKNEPIIGVIDTLFDESVYFSEWVEYKNCLDPNIDINIKDMLHGTAVSSIIVDGANINPNLDDGCGRFRVRHFGVATGSYFSAFTILRNIQNAVAENREIKVWNLSLGSSIEINKNFISPEAAELDKIQTEYDVVFIVAGTNKPKSSKDDMRIGAPADSINSLVVNSVDFGNNAASYSRVGPVLSFFYKPDVTYYGGDGKDSIRVYGPLGERFVAGTSFAAPWITRKMAYLIYNLGLTREVAKAVIIDSAARWDRQDGEDSSKGYGVVPVDINDIMSSNDDEIKFIINGFTETYETFAYNLPVPLDSDGKHPFFARATLCYFPNCSRRQGVDYTDTEMDFHFGRMILESKTNKAKVKGVDNNQQGYKGCKTDENDARKMHRKWDNVKHISEKIKPRSKPRKAYESKLWGVKVTVKERLDAKHGKIPFGLVVTLKEMNGKNRISDFVKACQLKGWLVNEINVENQIDVYNNAEEEIVFD